MFNPKETKGVINHAPTHMTHLIQSTLGKKNTLDLTGRTLDTVSLKWFESTRRIMRKTTLAGQDIAFKLFKEGQSLEHDDVVFLDNTHAILIAIEPCEVIVLSPKTLPDMARACYEIGNKHAPLFLEGDELLMPFEAPMFAWLAAAKFNPKQDIRRLSHALRSNSFQHQSQGHSHSHAHGHSHSHGDHSHSHDTHNHALAPHITTSPKELISQTFKAKQP